MFNFKLHSKLITGLLFVFISQLSIAGNVNGTGFVKGIFNLTGSIGEDYAYIDAVFGSHTCTMSGSYMIAKFDGDSSDGKRIYTTLLSAKLTGRKVTVSLDDPTSLPAFCWIRWVQIH